MNDEYYLTCQRIELKDILQTKSTIIVCRCSSIQGTSSESIFFIKMDNHVNKMFTQRRITRYPYENEKWAHVLHMGCPLKQWAAKWTGAAHLLSNSL